MNNMNLGPHRTRALEIALANAQHAKAPRFLCVQNGNYVQSTQPAPPNATTFGGEYLVVFSNGTYRSYDPRRGVKNEFT